MAKNKKKINRTVYDRTIETYEYNSNYDPKAEWVVDTAIDYENLYGTKYPKHDKNDYTKPTRDYKK